MVGPTQARVVDSGLLDDARNGAIPFLIRYKTIVPADPSRAATNIDEDHSSMVAQLIRSIEQEQFRDIPEFGAGDTVRVHAKVVEGTRERIQVFEGVVIRRRGGGINENFTVRRMASHGTGVERTFLIHSPRIDRIEVTRFGRVRRAKLYYLRGLTGRAARISERRRDLNKAIGTK